MKLFSVYNEFLYILFTNFTCNQILSESVFCCSFTATSVMITSLFWLTYRALYIFQLQLQLHWVLDTADELNCDLLLLLLHNLFCFYSIFCSGIYEKNIVKWKIYAGKMKFLNDYRDNSTSKKKFTIGFQ